jgi:hypothetical protein
MTVMVEMQGIIKEFARQEEEEGEGTLEEKVELQMQMRIPPKLR